jgi:hypothetical protein
MKAHSAALQYAGDIGHAWILNMSAGATFTQSHQLVAYRLNPDLAALLGVSTLILPSDSKNIFPTGSAVIKRQFQRTLVSVDYTASAGGGNGIGITARSQNAHGGISYTGSSKWNVGIDGNYANFIGFGNFGIHSSWYGGGVGFTYELVRYVHLTARLDALHYEAGAFFARPTTERATLGLSFTPKDIPLALW